MRFQADGEAIHPYKRDKTRRGQTCVVNKHGPDLNWIPVNAAASLWASVSRTETVAGAESVEASGMQLLQAPSGNEDFHTTADRAHDEIMQL